jgi:toxic protein SymE
VEEIILMADRRKEFRRMTVLEATDYSRQSTPMLRIRGLWLQDLGFVAGDSVLVHCEEGKLIVTKEAVWGETG